MADTEQSQQLLAQAKEGTPEATPEMCAAQLGRLVAEFCEDYSRIPSYAELAIALRADNQKQ